MPTINDVHQQFAVYFKQPGIQAYLYRLSQKMSEGHICISVDPPEAEALPDSYNGTDFVKSNLLSSELVGSAEAYRPFVLHRDKLYLHRYFHYETQVLERIDTLSRAAEGRIEERMTALAAIRPQVMQLFGGNTAAGPDWQLTAAIVAVLQDLAIITGGPGTGKTTTVAKILVLLYTLQPTLKVALAAPTGKAAARMAESLKQTDIVLPDEVRARFHELQPATIHRLLGWQEGSPYFAHDASNPLPFDLVIVDEASMIDVALFAKLLNAVADGSRIILLGDKDQLASVEAGSLFGDLCKTPERLNVFNREWLEYINTFTGEPGKRLGKSEMSEDDGEPLFQHIIELRHSHRFKGDEGIGILSKAVIRNDSAVLRAFINKGDSGDVRIDTTYDPALFEDFIKGYEAICTTFRGHDAAAVKAALEHLNTLRVLCAVREGEQGLLRLNSRAEGYLARRGLISLDSEYYEHRPVMVTRNIYAMGLYNGDIGLLRKDEAGVMRAWFLEKDPQGVSVVKSVLPGFITHMETVYAMTIHKSQGSEFDKALVILPEQGGKNLLTRELLYTGITRARKEVLIQASAEMLLQTAEAFVERGSGITDRLRSSY